MTSSPSSHSDGEILSSDSDKAKSLHSRNGISVDPQTRPSASAPRSPAARSRSPYRAHRGEKRRRDDDRSRDRDRDRADRRRFDVRYEDDRQTKRHRTHGSYEDLDPGHSKRSYLYYDDDSDRRHQPKRPRTRSRTRSRSPFRHTGKPSSFNSSQRRGHDTYESRGRQDRYSRGPGSGRTIDGEQSVRDRSSTPTVTHPTGTHAETARNHDLKDSEKARASDAADRKTELSTNAGHSADLVTPVLDEAAQIEERRKRREALKNKFRGPATPLRIQALHLNAEADSPASVDDGPSDIGTPTSPGPGSPQTPRDTSGIQSPLELSLNKDDDVAHASPDALGGDDEPSAADYDPIFDMQEERLRHDKSLFNEGSPTTRDDSYVQQVSNAVESSTAAPTSPAKPKDAFDMFAEDDDDDLDMFAEASTKPAKESNAEAKVAQALDVNMMDNWDDSEGYYNAILGELIQGRYSIRQNLGRGMFASVVRAYDNQTSHDVAIKIIRNNETMFKAGKKEIDILKDLATNDVEDKKHIIRLEGSFEHKGHLCMVFENFSSNLRELLKKYGRDVGLNIKAIRAYAQQLFLALSSMKKCQYLHADLKPDNILVGPKPDPNVKENVNILKLCDLGTASHITEAATAPYLVSRFYRAPELILGIPYDYGIDMWSAGCTLFELYTGKILFTGRNNNGMLRSIMECRGKFPHKLLRKGSESFRYFDDLLNFHAVEEDKVTRRSVTKVVEIKTKPVRDLRSRIVPKGKKMDEAERKEVELFLDLLEKCLDLRVDKRITPNEALKHPFILRMK